MNVNLNLLQAFIEVAELGSFRRAADAIGRTQSAVSMQIGQLEAQLGIKLFARTTRRVRLTTEGEQLLEHVRSAMTDLTAGLRQASGLGGPHRGRVTIACAPSVAGSRLPAVMAEFQRAFPQASAQLRELALAGIVDSVRMQDVDFGIGPLPGALNGLTFDPVASDPICALFPTGSLTVQEHDGGRHGVSLASLEGKTVVLMGGLRPTIDNACREHGVTLSVRYEAQQVLTVLGLVRAGLGVAVVPGIAVPKEVGRDLCLLPIVAPDLVRQIGIITQLGRRPTPLALELIRLLRKHLVGFGPGAHA
ncbi:MAG: LysR substrate-binding domain-containing protein [Janthinobacterium lividum]